MGSSNAIEAKAAVDALIKALPECAAEKWDVDWGYSKTPERTWVYVGEVNWDSSDWATNRSREEVFRLALVVNVKRRRTNAEGIEREVMRISGLIEAAVKADPILGIPAVVTTSYAPRKMDSFPSDEFGEAQLEADIRVTARF